MSVAELIAFLHRIPYDQKIYVNTGNGAPKLVEGVMPLADGILLIALQPKATGDGMAEYRRSRE